MTSVLRQGYHGMLSEKLMENSGGEDYVGKVGPGLTILDLINHGKKLAFYSKCSGTLTENF